MALEGIHALEARPKSICSTHPIKKTETLSGPLGGYQVILATCWRGILFAKRMSVCQKTSDYYSDEELQSIKEQWLKDKAFRKCIRRLFKMDITQDLKRKKRKSGRGLEKQSRDKHIEDLENNPYKTIVDGKVIEMASDLKALPEFDWDDPKNNWFVKQMGELEQKRIKKYGRLTMVQMNKIMEISEVLMKQQPGLTKKGAFDLAWEKITREKLSAQSD